MAAGVDPALSPYRQKATPFAENHQLCVDKPKINDDNMSRIELLRGRDGIIKREMWDTEDIANYCNIDFESAGKLLVIANKACGYKGYGDIHKVDFLRFYDEIERERESRRLQDEANAATILFAEKNYRLNFGSTMINQALSLLSSL